MTYKSVLITGGTGSLGRALAKKLINDDSYYRIVIFSRDEHKQEKMAEEFNSPKLRFFIGDVRDPDRLKLAMSQINCIIHTAALKIVPSGEYNPTEYIQTNVMGTMNAIRAAYTVGVPDFTLVSTDKAVAPINLYGATKLCAERLTLAANNMFAGMRCNIVRYGNVANSNGSILQVFRRQFEAGLPLTITDPRMTRFWIELDQAAEFVVNSAEEMATSKIFIPEMPSFYIKDLADAFYGTERLLLDKHKIIGIREGEKLHEQIENEKFSNRNDLWLNIEQLHLKLKDLGVIGQKKQ